MWTFPLVDIPLATYLSCVKWKASETDHTSHFLLLLLLTTYVCWCPYVAAATKGAVLIHRQRYSTWWWQLVALLAPELQHTRVNEEIAQRNTIFMSNTVDPLKGVLMLHCVSNHATGSLPR